MKYRRFGRTEFRMPVISSGGMRFQQSWNGKDEVTDEEQKRLEACVHHALELGVNHIETARGYGTSEEQLGRILPSLPRDEILVQTKVGPMENVDKFRATFEKSMRLLQLDYIDIFSFHGINDEQSLEYALRCYDIMDDYRKEGRVRDIGFSTHGTHPILVKAIETGLFDHINLHWYYIYQDNWPAIEAAKKQDMGVFIISPNDKGGKLYAPSDKLCELTHPLHPMVFNGLFCLMHPEVHTLSCGVSQASDFDIHMEVADKLDNAAEYVNPIVERLENEMANMLGEEWASSWREGLPEWDDAPGEINVNWVLRLRNLAIAYDMVEYGKMRYNMLSKGGAWMPGNKGEKALDFDWTDVLQNSKHAAVIPDALVDAHELLDGEAAKRLQLD